MAQVVVHPTSKQEVRGSILERGTNGNFSKYFNRGFWWFGTHLKLVGPIIKKSVTSREEAPCRGANYFWGFLGDFERFVCTDSGRLSKPVKGREYKLIHTFKVDF